MIFLEQTVNQILREEGQLIVSLEDLQITWEMLQDVFIGTYEQAKQYISIYDWTTDTLSTTPQTKNDWAHVRHITYNAYNNMQRFMPDVPGQYWEFNPYTKNANSLMNANFSFEVSKYPSLEPLDVCVSLNCKKERKQPFLLPCTFEPDTFIFGDMTAYQNYKKEDEIVFEGNNSVGSFNTKTLSGYIITDADYSGTLQITSKYLGIKELDLSCELFYLWFKGHVMSLLGSMKKQIDLQGVGLPFDLNSDLLLERGRQILDMVEGLKGTKSHWSNF